jgi:hypothetical protein
MRSKFILMIMIICVIVGTLSWSQAYSQAKVESVGQKDKVAISNYLSVLDEKTHLFGNRKSKEESDAFFDAMNQEELKHTAHLMFDASDANAATLEDSLISRSRRIDQENVRGEKWGEKPGGIQQGVLNEIKRKISGPVSVLLRIAYLLKIQVSKVDAVPDTISGRFIFKKIVVTASVLRVYKGTGSLKPGDEVQFFYVASWVAHPITFKAGQEYLAPLNYDLKLYTSFDPTGGYYPIENGELNDAYNLFGFGKRLEFNTFETKLDSMIKEVKSW